MIILYSLINFVFNGNKEKCYSSYFLSYWENHPGSNKQTLKIGGIQNKFL